MLGLKLTLNDGDSIVGAAPDLGVLVASVTLAGRLGPLSQHPRPGEAPDLMVQLGGKTSRAPDQADERVIWLSKYDLQPGDRITLEIVETEQANEPISRPSADIN